MAKNSLQVDVMEATGNEVRTITIVVTGSEEDFLLADLPAQRKAILSSAAVLENAALEATKSYLEGAEVVINGAKPDWKKDGSITGETPPKRGLKVMPAASADGFRLGTMTVRTMGPPFHGPAHDESKDQARAPARVSYEIDQVPGGTWRLQPRRRGPRLSLSLAMLERIRRSGPSSIMYKNGCHGEWAALPHRVPVGELEASIVVYGGSAGHLAERDDTIDGNAGSTVVSKLKNAGNTLRV